MLTTNNSNALNNCALESRKILRECITCCCFLYVFHWKHVISYSWSTVHNLQNSFIFPWIFPSSLLFFFLPFTYTINKSRMRKLIKVMEFYWWIKFFFSFLFCGKQKHCKFIKKKTRKKCYFKVKNISFLQIILHPIDRPSDKVNLS